MHCLPSQGTNPYLQIEVPFGTATNRSYTVEWVTVHGLARRRGSLLGRERTEPETGKQRVARI